MTTGTRGTTPRLSASRCSAEFGGRAAEPWRDRRHHARLGSSITDGVDVTTPPVGYNTVFEVHWKGGWPGIFTGESQAKALTRCLAQLNNEGWRVSAAVTDRWPFFKRLGTALVAIVTLGFVVDHQNIVLVVELIS